MSEKVSIEFTDEEIKFMRSMIASWQIKECEEGSEGYQMCDYLYEKLTWYTKEQIQKRFNDWFIGSELDAALTKMFADLIDDPRYQAAHGNKKKEEK
jgi:hypothetical protein